MCFSLHMSFFAAGLLTSIGILALRKVTHRSHIPLASLPLIFAAQQAAEGMLWLLLPTDSYPLLITFSKYVFLGIATIVWPLFIPFTLLLIEPQSIRRALLAGCLIIAMGWSLAALWYAIQYGAIAEIRQCHMYYAFFNNETNVILQGITYCVTTLAPFFISSNHSIRILGGLITGACIITYIVWYSYFVSVWCFFAALLSMVIYRIISTKPLTQ